jgi:hypothetical protein
MPGRTDAFVISLSAMYGRPLSARAFWCFGKWIGERSCIRPVMRPVTAGPDGERGSNSNHLRRAVTRDDVSECFDSGFLTICHHTMVILSDSCACRKSNPDILMIQSAQHWPMAKRIGAKTVTLKTSHAVMLPKPQEVADVIPEAADR